MRPFARCVLMLAIALALLGPGDGVQAQAAGQRGIRPVAPQPAGAQSAEPQPGERPLLRLETGMHAAAIRQIAVGRDGVLVTVADDKTARLWSTEGALLRTFRVPVGQGAEGALYAAAITPDGATIAVGGSTGLQGGGRSAVYLFSMETGQLTRRLRGIQAPITALAFAPDGARLAIGYAHGGMAAFDLVANKLLLHDAAYTDRVQGLAFDAAGYLASAAWDGAVRLYAPALTPGPIRMWTMPDGGRPGDLAFSPDGKSIAVGAANRPQVRVLDARTLAQIAAPPLGPALTRQPQFDLSAVAWATGPGSPALLAAGQVSDAAGNSLVLRWTDLAQPPAAQQAVAENRVNHLAPLPGGRVAYAAADPAWGILDAAIQPAVQLRAATAEFRNPAPGTLRVSSDGLTVEFGMSRGGKRLHRFDARLRRLDATPEHRLAPNPAPALVVRDWQNGPEPAVGRRTLRLDPNELGRSLAIAPDGSRFLLGTDTRLRLYAADGAMTGSIEAPDTVWGVAFSPNGAMAVATLGDGTLRWYDLRGGAPVERVALFPHRDGRRWVAWTVDGRFDHADEGGQDLAGFVLNPAPDAAGPAAVPKWVSLSQLYRSLYTPDLVSARMAPAAPGPDRQAADQPPDVRDRLAAAAPPRLVLEAFCYTRPDAAPSEGQLCQPLGAAVGKRGIARVKEATDSGAAAGQGGATLPPGVRSITLRARVQDGGGGLGQVDLFLNERNVGRSVVERNRSEGVGDLVERQVPLDEGLNRLQLRGYEQTNRTYGETPVLEIATAAGSAAATLPRMFILAVAINEYVNPWTPALGLAVSDATEVAQLLQSRPVPNQGPPVTKILRDKDATRAAILAAFDSIKRQAQPQDTVVVYLAGHGIQEGGSYLFVPWLPPGTPRAALTQSGISDRELLQLWSSLPARNGVLLLDTCHAGAFSLDFAGALAHESGRYVVAAASAVQEALDDSGDGLHGPFGAAVLEALRGEGARRITPDAVDQFALGWHVRERVPLIASRRGHTQRAEFRGRADDLTPFPLARLVR